MTISPSTAVRILHPNLCAPQFEHMRTQVQPTEESVVSETQLDYLSALATAGLLASINSRQSPLSIPGKRFQDVVGSAYYVAPEVLKRKSGPESLWPPALLQSVEDIWWILFSSTLQAHLLRHAMLEFFGLDGFL